MATQRFHKEITLVANVPQLVRLPFNSAPVNFANLDDITFYYKASDQLDTALTATVGGSDCNKITAGYDFEDTYGGVVFSIISAQAGRVLISGGR